MMQFGSPVYKIAQSLVGHSQTNVFPFSVGVWCGGTKSGTFINDVQYAVHYL